jgi:hypothetical protein
VLSVRPRRGRSQQAVPPRRWKTMPANRLQSALVHRLDIPAGLRQKELQLLDRSSLSTNYWLGADQTGQCLAAIARRQQLPVLLHISRLVTATEACSRKSTHPRPQPVMRIS